MCCCPTVMVSCKVCWSVKQIDRLGVGSRIMGLLSLLEGPYCNQRTYIFISVWRICDLLSLFMRLLEIDLGSSFIKGAMLDLAARSFDHVRRRPFPAPLPNLPPDHFEVEPRQVVAATRALIEELLAIAPDCAGLVMCSQMHGLV